VPGQVLTEALWGYETGVGPVLSRGLVWARWSSAVDLWPLAALTAAGLLNEAHGFLSGLVVTAGSPEGVSLRASASFNCVVPLMGWD
jgi:hypothetical protein